MNSWERTTRNLSHNNCPYNLCRGRSAEPSHVWDCPFKGPLDDLLGPVNPVRNQILRFDTQAPEITIGLTSYYNSRFPAAPRNPDWARELPAPTPEWTRPNQTWAQVAGQSLATRRGVTLPQINTQVPRGTPNHIINNASLGTLSLPPPQPLAVEDIRYLERDNTFPAPRTREQEKKDEEEALREGTKIFSPKRKASQTPFCAPNTTKKRQPPPPPPPSARGNSPQASTRQQAVKSAAQNLNKPTDKGKSSSSSSSD